jgi:hypothetical protein
VGLTPGPARPPVGIVNEKGKAGSKNPQPLSEEEEFGPRKPWQLHFFQLRLALHLQAKGKYHSWISEL